SSRSRFPAIPACAQSPTPKQGDSAETPLGVLCRAHSPSLRAQRPQIRTHPRHSLADAHGLSHIAAWQTRRRYSVATARLHVRQKVRSEEHTSELQSRFDLVCRLLLEKKNT